MISQVSPIVLTEAPSTPNVRLKSYPIIQDIPQEKAHRDAKAKKGIVRQCNRSLNFLFRKSMDKLNIQNLKK